MDFCENESGPESDLADLVDFDVTPEQVLDRVEQCVVALIEELSQGRLQTIQTVCMCIS